MDIDICDRRRKVVEKQFGDLFLAGAVTMQAAIIPAHAAVSAILPAKIRNLDHGAHENVLPKAGARRLSGGLMQRRLSRSAHIQIAFSQAVHLRQFFRLINAGIARSRARLTWDVTLPLLARHEAAAILPDWPGENSALAQDY
ncbi:MAG: hypothetical protein ABSG04_14660 [Verrucomicrobiota bacterium]